MHGNPRAFLALATTGCLLVGATALPGAAQNATPMAGAGSIGTPLVDASGAEAGSATFEAGDGGVTVTIAVEGLEPGEHGWHLHAMGECDGSTLEPFSTAGPHWNPTGAPHGGPDDEMAHVGDFGNLTAGDDGRAEFTLTTDRFTLDDGPTGVMDTDGTAIIVHQGVDDLVSQPAGNSGGRYACGVVAAPMGMEGSPTPITAESNVLKPAQVAFTPDLLGNLQVPDGFEIAVFAQGLGNPRMMAVGPDGAVYVTQPDANTVSMLRDTDGDFVIDETSVVSSNLKQVHGIAIREGQVYLAGEKQIWLADVNDDGTFGEPDVIVDGLPDGDQHARRSVRFGPDGMMYVHLGSSCNDCIETIRENATIMRFNPDGSGGEIFASGLRNTLGWVWHPETGEMWGMDMGTDRRGDDTPPDELNLIEQGGNYGWPWCYADQQIDAEISYPNPPGATQEQYCANTVGSVMDYQAHSSPIDMLLYEGDMFGDEYAGSAFVTMRGSWNRAEPSGYKVVRLTFDGGQPAGFEDFITGWLLDGGTSQFGRIAGLAVLPDGSLLISEDSNGVIYRVSAQDA